MKTISQKYNLSAVYTNHSLRATTITLLDGKGIGARQIMAISGHKSESSIRSYSRTDDTKRRQIAETISEKILGDGEALKAKVRKTDKTDVLVQHSDGHDAPEGDINPAPPVQSGQVVELNNTDIDFLELTSSQEHLLMESLSHFTTNNEARSNDATMKTVAMRHESTSRVLTERKPNVPNNLVFHNVNNVHIHYH